MKKLSLIFTIFFVVNFSALAQQTIFNVPSATITKKNQNFVQHESQFRTQDNGRFLSTTNYYARGIGYNTELDATLFNWGTPASQNVTLGLGFKKAFLLDKESSKYQPKLVVGAMLAPSLQSQGIGHWIYGLGSFVIPESKTRLSLGLSSGSKQIFGKNSDSIIAGFEQPITKKFSIIADWYSGNSSYGLLSTGFSYDLPYSISLFSGYQIPNSKKAGRHSFVVEVARVF